MFPIAILQGRLSPDPGGRFQFFPRAWEKEFAIARNLGFEGLEWLVDPNDPAGWRNNPALTMMRTFVTEESMKEETPIVSVCADWFMNVSPFCGWSAWHQDDLLRLMPFAALTANRLILVPLLERHSIVEYEKRERSIEVFKPLADALERFNLSIGFETELPADELVDFLERFESNRFGVYYDVGNCTSYGFDCPADIRLLGTRIKGVHVKDRKVGSTQSVMLGEGDADFVDVLKALRDVNWKGTLVMQAWRGKETYVEDAQRQLAYLRKLMEGIDAE